MIVLEAENSSTHLTRAANFHYTSLPETAKWVYRERSDAQTEILNRTPSPKLSQFMSLFCSFLLAFRDAYQLRTVH